MPDLELNTRPAYERRVRTSSQFIDLVGTVSVIYFGMTITRAEKHCLPQRSTELIASAGNTSDCSIWPLYVGVQSVSSRIETEAELDS